MEESNDSPDSPQSNAKRVKIDTEHGSVTCTNTSDSDINKDMPTSSSNAMQNNVTQLTLASSPPKTELLAYCAETSQDTAGTATQKPENEVDKEEAAIESCETTSDPVASGTNADCPNEIDSDDTSSDNDSQPSRPRMRRERNYRRRVYYDTSSMESYDFNQPRSASRNSLFDESFLNLPHHSPSNLSPPRAESSVDNDSISESWAAQESDSDSTFESNDRFRFEPNEEVDAVIEAIMQKQKSKYTWHSVPSLMYRQNGFSSGKALRHTVDTPYNFQANVRGSLHGVERLDQLCKLSDHFGCINCLNFSQNGKLLASGSDDLKIKVWNWARKRVVATINTSHVSNIFQAKFIDYDGLEGGFQLVSSDQSGAVRQYLVGPCGAVRVDKLLHGSPRAVHKLGLPSNRPYEVLSVGEDCRVMLIDLREGNATRLLRAKCPLYSIACHPLDSNEFCLGGQDQYVRVYDRRSVKTAVRDLCPKHLVNKRDHFRSVTSAVYNYVGSEILASYSNESVYLFDSRTGDCLHKYSGHRNNRTIKGVNFYGPRSEFVVSGSENPGHVFFWEKETEAIVQMIVADSGGVVNCLEPHPSVPIIATSGLADEIKLWHPSNQEDPNLKDVRKFVSRNMNIQMNRQDRNSGIDIFQFILQRMRMRTAEEQYENRDDDEQGSDADSQPSNSSSSDDDDEFDQRRLNACNTS